MVTSWKKEGIAEGLEKGRQEGREEGQKEGLQKGRQEVILKQLRLIVGPLSGQQELKVKRLGVEKLDLLSEALLDFTSPSDLNNWFKNNK